MAAQSAIVRKQEPYILETNETLEKTRLFLEQYVNKSQVGHMRIIHNITRGVCTETNGTLVSLDPQAYSTLQDLGLTESKAHGFSIHPYILYPSNMPSNGYGYGLYIRTTEGEKEKEVVIDFETAKKQLEEDITSLISYGYIKNEDYSIHYPKVFDRNAKESKKEAPVYTGDIVVVFTKNYIEKRRNDCVCVKLFLDQTKWRIPTAKLRRVVWCLFHILTGWYDESKKIIQEKRLKSGTIRTPSTIHVMPRSSAGRGFPSPQKKDDALVRPAQPPAPSPAASAAEAAPLIQTDLQTVMAQIPRGPSLPFLPVIPGGAVSK